MQHAERRAGPTHLSGKPRTHVGMRRIPSRPGARDSAAMTRSFTVFFRDSEECLRCLSHRAASESEAREWFTRVGIAVVAITAEARLAAIA